MKCSCCGPPIWIMLGPVLCTDCKHAGCDPFDTACGAKLMKLMSDFGEITHVEQTAPCRKEAL